MQTRIRTLVAAIVLLGVMSTQALADNHAALTSKTPLTAAEEVQNPAVESDGLSNAIITFGPRYRKAEVRVTFGNLEGEVTRLHLHCAPAGENGPIAIGLVDLVAVSQDNSESVTLDANTIIGTVRNRQFPDAAANACGIRNLRDLARAINIGFIYWNLHTTAFPAGELRGQVAPLAPTRARRDD
ncbi:MAG: CHRD domain-containing protein [Pseudomonadota bacterium]